MSAAVSLALAEHPFLRNLAPSFLVELARCAEIRTLAAGEHLFHVGEPGGDLLLLCHGRVVLETPDVASFRILGAGELLGSPWLDRALSWTCDGRIVEPTEVAVLRGDCLRRKCEVHPALGYELMKRIVRRLHEEVEELRGRLGDALPV